MQVLKKILLAAVAPLAVLGSVALAGAGAANAAPTATALAAHTDEITNIAALYNGSELGSTPVPVMTSVTSATFSALDSEGKPLTWSVASALPPGLTFSFTGDVATVTTVAPFSPPASVTVKVTDGTAIGFATVHAAAVGSAVDLTMVTDTVAFTPLHAVNAGGTATFATTPAATETLAGAPGFVLTGDVLSGGIAFPGNHPGATVTAQAGGAVAVETFDAFGGTVLPIHPVVPYVYAGHVITVDNNSATVGWSDSTLGWPSANHCVEVREFGFGFTVNGSPHVGFTCDNGNPAQDVGYLSGLAPHHTYFLQVVPAVGTYGDNHQIPGTDAHGGIDVVTTS
jgi:hypothetical protein